MKERTRRYQSRKHLYSIMVVANLTLAGCSTETQDTSQLEKVERRELTIVQPSPTPVDIIFVVDNSGSMENEQRSLANSFTTFIQQIAPGGNYRIAVISTDSGFDSSQTLSYEKVGWIEPTFQEKFPYTRTGFDNSDCRQTDIQHGCFRGNLEKVITSEMSIDKQTYLFYDNVFLGSCGGGEESGMSSIALALEYMQTGNCNEDFLREDANLVIIFVSDEDDQKTKLSPATFIETLERHKPLEKVRIAVIAGINSKGEPESCRNNNDTCGSFCNARLGEGSLLGCDSVFDCPETEYCSAEGQCTNSALQYFSVKDINGDPYCSWCSFYNTEDCCSARRASRYVEVARLLEQRVTEKDPRIQKTSCNKNTGGKTVACILDSICQDNFSETLQGIARELVNPARYFLEPPACTPESIVVILGTEMLTYLEDFILSEDGEEIIFTGKSPTPDDRIQVYLRPNYCN